MSAQRVRIRPGFDAWNNTNSAYPRHYDGLDGAILWPDVNEAVDGTRYLFVHFTTRDGQAQYWPVPLRFLEFVTDERR